MMDYNKQISEYIEENEEEIEEEEEEWMKSEESELLLKKCSYCDYKSDRSDNLKRHQNEKHLKMLKKCGCGHEFTASALSRHRKRNCPMRKDDRKTPLKKPRSSIDLSAFNISSNDVVDLKEHSIATKVVEVTLKDGSMVILHNSMKIGRFVMTFQPADEDSVNLSNNDVNDS